MHARQPERERRREGVALPNLIVAARTPDSITLEAKEGRMPLTNIAPGSEVALVEAGEREELCRGIVGKISRRGVTVEFPGGAPRHQLPRLITVNLVFDAKDRKSTRLNSSHGYISYAVFCLKKKKTSNYQHDDPA